MRMPEPGPLGDTFVEARLRAMVAALLVNKPAGGWVESVCTLATHLRFEVPFLVMLSVYCLGGFSVIGGFSEDFSCPELLPELHVSEMCFMLETWS